MFNRSRPVFLAASLLASLAFPMSVQGAEPTRFDISRSGSTYTARPDTGTVYTGRLKAVVERAVADLNARGGGLIQFGSGTYDLETEYLRLRSISNITFAGASMTGTTLRNDTSAAADTEPFNMQTVSGLVIRDMTVIAGGPLRTTSDALDFDNGSNNQVLRIRITASRGRGIVFDGKDGTWRAEGNLVKDCEIDGVSMDGIQFLAASKNRIEGCEIRNTGRHGIQATKASSTAAQPNKPSNDNVIVDNVIDQAGTDGISILSSSRNQILRNRITNSSDNVTSGNGIRITSAEGVACNDNVVGNALAADRNTATDTQSTKTQRYGLYISSAVCSRTVVGANDFAGNLLGRIRDLGTGTIYRTDSQAPTTPTGLSASAPSSTRVELRWSASSDNVGVTGYTVYRNDAEIATVGGSTLTYADTAVSAGTTYTYRVDAFDAAGLRSAKSAADTVTTPDAGGGGVTARIVADTYIDEDPALPPTTAYGTRTTLRVDASPVRRTYLRFDVQGLSSAPARVVLRVFAMSGSSIGHTVHGVSNDTWSEAGTNATNAPAVGSAVGSSGRFAASTWTEVDVTSLVTGNGLHSFALTTPSSTAISYASRESANDPQLIVTP